MFRGLCTYFPSFIGSTPKLEPTIPVQMQFSSAAFVHLAVATVPISRHVIDADVGKAARTATAFTKRMMTMVSVKLGSTYGPKKRSNYCLTYFIRMVCSLGHDRRRRFNRELFKDPLLPKRHLFISHCR